AVPPDPRSAAPAGPGVVDPRRTRGTARAPPPRGALLGRLLALDRALPARRRRALRLPRRRRDERAPRAPLRRAAPVRPRCRRGESRLRAAGPECRARARRGRRSVLLRRRRARELRAALDGADRGRGLRLARGAPPRGAPAPPQPARVRRRGGRA